MIEVQTWYKDLSIPDSQPLPYILFLLDIFPEILGLVIRMEIGAGKLRKQFMEYQKSDIHNCKAHLDVLL